MERPQGQLCNECTVDRLGFRRHDNPPIEMLQARHPFFRIEQRDGCQVIRNSTNFFSQKYTDWRDRLLHFNTIAFKLLDAFGQELVVVDERP